MRLEATEKHGEKCFGALIYFLCLHCQGAVTEAITEVELMEEGSEVCWFDI